MRQYETGFLISPSLSEEEVDKLISQMAEAITKKKGKMLKEDRWGKRKLAYPIDKFEEAFYVFFHYNGNPDVPPELERRFRQSDAVLHYLTIRKEEMEKTRKKKALRTKKEKKAKPPEEPPLEEDVSSEETKEEE